MNGLGNEIVVVDLRRGRRRRSAPARRARRAPQGEPYDQLMALYPPRTRGTDALVRIYNNDGSEAGACGNGMRCIAALVSARDRQGRTEFRDRRPALFPAGARRDGLVHRRHGRAALCAGTRFRWRRRCPTRARSTCSRTDRRADPAFAVRRQHGQSARDLLGRRCDGLRSAPDRPAAGTPSALSRARQHLARRRACARPHRDAHLGARRRPHQGLRLGGLRRGRRRRAAAHAPAARSRSRCPAATLRSNGAKRTTMC